jgi:adenine-specific DNA-methyltransferase
MSRPKIKHPASVHGAVRAAARALKTAAPLSTAQRLALCRQLMSGTIGSPTPWDPAEGQTLSSAERAYRVSALYISLMSPGRRQKLAAYFTPPHLCEHVLDRLEAHGWEPAQHSILDPACGGAAFLAPAAYRMRVALENAGLLGPAILKHIRSKVAGVEIDGGLRDLSEMLVGATLAETLASAGEERIGVVRRGNALKLATPSNGFDAVISNPPYGRVFRASGKLRDRWSTVISDGHVNTYALFIALALEQVKPSGIVAVVVPTSFISGPYFRNLRSYILSMSHILELNIIEKRADVFMDVVQDTCVLILRRNSESTDQRSPPRASVIAFDGETKVLGTLDAPDSGDRPWALPGQVAGDPAGLFSINAHNLETYGYRVKAGYFVWNRSRELLAEGSEPQENSVPLIWAHNIRAGEPVLPRSRPNALSKAGDISFVRVPVNSPAIQRAPALVIQRTTNRSQSRRLVCGVVPQEVVDRYGGYVTENHTIVIIPTAGREQLVDLNLLAKILSTAAVDRAYRRVSGTVSISAKVLQKLSLPIASEVKRLLEAGLDMEEAVNAAYK